MLVKATLGRGVWARLLNIKPKRTCAPNHELFMWLLQGKVKVMSWRCAIKHAKDARIKMDEK